jgi:DNA-binding winged helix-turn-helix (wHTH) protein
MVRFGPFTLDPRTWTITRGGKDVDLSPHLVQILVHLVERRGAIVTKEELLDRFWPDVHVTENTLTRAIADIRKALDDDASKPRYVQTLARRGYRFVGETAAAPTSAWRPEAHAGRPDGGDVFQDWVKGRLALESLDESRLPDARAAFERAVVELPQYAPAHAGLANALLLGFEASRIGGSADPALLARGIDAAEDACRLDPTLGEAWATLGHLLALGERVEESRAAARRAAALEPDNWRHQFRLAFATWGEERLRASDRTLALMPSCAAAHFLAAMVFIARGALQRARQSATIGAELQERQKGGGAILPAAGCWWLAGLIRLADSTDVAEARACLGREIAAERDNGLYGREFAGRARAVLARLDAPAGERDIQPPDAVIERLLTMLSTAPPGPAGWSIPVDPALKDIRKHPGFARVLAVLASRAA